MEELGSREVVRGARQTVTKRYYCGEVTWIDAHWNTLAAIDSVSHIDTHWHARRRSVGPGGTVRSEDWVMENFRRITPLVEVLTRTAAFDRVCIGAFSGRRVARFRRLTQNRVCTSMGPTEVARLRASSYGVPVGRFAPACACAQVPARAARMPLVDRRFVDAAHRRDLQVHVWTINDADEMGRLLDLGVDGIMTDRPAVLKEVLERRQAWA